MKKVLLLAGAAALFAISANAQVDTDLQCKDYYLGNHKMFIQIGAGAELPAVEGWDQTKHFTASYDFAIGKWFSPYAAWRLEAYGGSMHSNLRKGMQHNKMVVGNFDIMWNMFNSLGGVNQKRVFNINPFIGAGLAYTWDFAKPVYRKNVLVPQISAGLQFNFRLCNYVDFFLQGRVMAAADNFNGLTTGRPADLNFQGVGGFIFNLGGKDFKSFNPCDYTDYINSLNEQNNALRGDLAATAAALAAAQALLPCPELVEEVTEVTTIYPTIATVIFNIGSSKIRPEELVNVYNVAEFMKENSDLGVIITGKADSETGNDNINGPLSKDRAEAVKAMLVKEYGIDAARIATANEIVSTKDAGAAPKPAWNRCAVVKVK